MSRSSRTSGSLKAKVDESIRAGRYGEFPQIWGKWSSTGGMGEFDEI